MKLLAGPAEGAVAVTVISLEMTDSEALVPAPAPPGAIMRVVVEPRPDLSHDFYVRVGADWHWVDRLEWTDQQWTAWVDRPEHHLLICERDGVEAGYAELEQQADGQVEIAYFGLLPSSFGGGMGTWWLSQVIAYAWSLPGTQRVWVHTCTLDSPAALPTYVGRGLREYAREVEWRMPG